MKEKKRWARRNQRKEERKKERKEKRRKRRGAWEVKAKKPRWRRKKEREKKEKKKEKSGLGREEEERKPRTKKRDSLVWVIVWYESYWEINLDWQGLDNSQTMGPTNWVELQNYYHNSIFITQKHQEIVFILTHSLLILLSYEWWELKMKT